MNITNQRIRLAVDTSSMGSVNDAVTGATPQFWNGVDLQFELAVFYGAALADISNLSSLTVDVKASDSRTGLPVMSQTLAAASLNNALTLSAWQGGAAADSHALVVFPNSSTDIALTTGTQTFWIVISAVTTDSPAHKLVLGAGPLNVVESGEGVAAPSEIAAPLYFNAAQSDSRYLAQTGGTLTGALNINSASGLEIQGVKVLGPQQSHIAHDTSGSATGAILNQLLTALETHGLLHS